MDPTQPNPTPSTGGMTFEKLAEDLRKNGVVPVSAASTPTPPPPLPPRPPTPLAPPLPPPKPPPPPPRPSLPNTPKAPELLKQQEKLAPPPQRPSWGALVGIIIIVFVLIVGALYFWGAKLAQEEQNGFAPDATNQ